MTRYFLDFIDYSQYIRRHIGQTNSSEKAVQHQAVIDVNRELAESKLLENIVNYRWEFRIGRHAFRTNHINVALVEFAETASLGSLGAVHFANLVTPEREDQLTFMFGDIARQRHR